MTTVRFGPEHSGMLLALWNSAVPHDTMSAALFHEKVFTDVAVDETLRIASFEGAEALGFAVGCRRSTTANAGSIKLFAVSEPARRSGVGSALVNRIEAELFAAGATKIRIGESPPNYLQPGVDRRYVQTMAFLESLGYVEFAQTYNMDVNLADADLDTATEELRLHDIGFEISAASANSADPLRRFIDSVFPAWRGEVDAALANPAPSVYFCSRENTVVGFAALDGNNRGTGWFGPMGTAPEHRGLGIGEVLLKRALSDIRDRGHNTAIIPWVGPVPFYERTVRAYVSRTFARMEKSIGNAI